MFVSGLSTLHKSLLLSVGNCLQQIEIEADIGCCQRLESLKGSLVVVLLLSDAYLCSQRCREEFISAFCSHQNLVPILLPDNGDRNEQGISVGWTGPGDSEYWRHAVNMGSSDESVDWSLLRHFAPLQYPSALTSDAPRKKDCVDFARLVAARINKASKEMEMQTRILKFQF